MAINKQSIKKLIGQGKLPKALEDLKLLADQNDDDLQNTIILQSARLKSLKNDEQMGMISFDNASRVKAQITYALLSLVDDLEDSEDQAVTDANAEKPEIPDGKKEDVNVVKGSSITSTILFVAANPKDSDNLRLGDELSKITESLRFSAKREEIRIEQEWSIEIKDLRRAMLRYNPNIVHFSGHGSSDGGIMLEDSEGYGQAIDIVALGEFFALFKDSIKCVILNSCYSEPQAKEIAKSIPYVIGVNDNIPDETSIAFAEAFYDAFGAGKSIEDAFSFARNNIAMSGLDGEELPILLTK